MARRRRRRHDRGASGLQATVSGSGDHLFETRVVDMAGNASGWRAEQVRIDTLPPANTTATPTSPEDNPYTVSVTGTDAHSSIAAVEWRVDGGAVQTGAVGATATVTGNGAHTLETRVLDAAGNSSGWRTDSFTIDAVTGDATPPVDTTTTVSSAWRVSPVAITVSATDSGSGVERVEWRLDGQPVQSGPSGSFTISTDGVHDLETRAFDVARQRLRLALADDPRRPHGADRHHRPPERLVRLAHVHARRPPTPTPGSPTSSTRSTVDRCSTASPTTS